MTDLAARAIENSMQMEVKKDGLIQRQNSDWTLRLVVQNSDLHKKLSDAPMGTRYVAVLVEIGDNEEPVVSLPPFAQPSPVTTNQPATSSGHQPDAVNVAGKVKRKWHELSYTEQACIRCNDPKFSKFIAETYSEVEHLDNAEFVRDYCGVKTRTDIKPSTTAGKRWEVLNGNFEVWDRYPDAGEPW